MPPPLPSWFLMQPPSNVHGIGHTARVMVWAAVLTRGSSLFASVVWAAACHDLRRENDGPDPEHGFRAGDWVRKVLLGKLQRPLPDLELIAQACDWHVCPDNHSGWDHEVLWYLKDADGLDRVRIQGLDPSYLRHAETRQWIEQAERLYQVSADANDAETIWENAAALQLPVCELIEFFRGDVQFRSGA
jgi:hypothetical protein